MGANVDLGKLLLGRKFSKSVATSPAAEVSTHNRVLAQMYHVPSLISIESKCPFGTKLQMLRSG